MVSKLASFFVVCLALASLGVALWWAAMPLTVTVGSGSIALVQNGAITETIISTATPIPITLATPSTAGTFLLAAIGTGNPGALPSITNMPAGWVNLTAAIANSATDWEFWGLANNPGGISSISPTANCGVAGARWYTHLSEWSGVLSVSYLDASGTATATAGTTLVPQTTTALVASKSVAIAGWMQQIGIAGTNTFTSPAGFTRLIDTSALNRSQHLAIEYMANPTPGGILAVTLTSDTVSTQASSGLIVLAPKSVTQDETAYLSADSLNIKTNTFDFGLLLGGKLWLETSSDSDRSGILLEDGSGVLLLDTYIPQLGDPVAMTNPTWNGRVVSVTRADLDDLLTNYRDITVAATNNATAPGGSAPGDLSDNPSATGGAGGFLLLEDGSKLLLEDGSGDLLLEGTSFAYSHLSVQQTQNIDGTVTNYGTCTVYETGFAAGQTFLLTSQNLGFTNQQFTIQNVTIKFLYQTPEYDLEFGDAYQTLQKAGGGVLTQVGSQASVQQGAAVPAGTLGYAQVTANQGTFTAATDLTGLTVTVTVGSGRRIRITGQVILASSVSNDSVLMNIVEGVTNVYQASLELTTTGGGGGIINGVAIVQPSAGVHTYKLQGARQSGSGNITLIAGTNQIAFIMVEDVGS